MNKRLKNIRLDLGLNQGEFAKRIGISQGMLSGIEHGRESLTDRTIKIVCLEFKVNEDWLRTGTGEMFKKVYFLSPESVVSSIALSMGELSYDEVDIIENYRKLDKTTKEEALTYVKRLYQLQEKLKYELKTSKLATEPQVKMPNLSTYPADPETNEEKETHPVHEQERA